MNNFFKSVDDEWRSELADSILSNWEHDEGTLRVIRASANFVCIFKNRGEHYFLRFNTEEERSLKLVEAEIELLNDLLARNINVSRPISSLNNRYVETVSTDLGTIHAIVTKRIMGEHPEFEELEDKDFYQIGKLLGNLHKEMKLLCKDKTYNRLTWEGQFNYAEEHINENDVQLKDAINKIKNACYALPKNDDNYGLIHYDFEVDNLIDTDHHELGIIDFDDASYNWYISDILYSLRDLMDGFILNESKQLDSYLNGYRSETSFDQELFEQRDLLIKAHNIFQYGRVYRSRDIEINEETPEWLANIDNNLGNLLEKLRVNILK